MINLLPDEIKRDMGAARMNIVLLRYNVMVLSGVVIMSLFCLTFYFVLSTNQSTYLSTSNSNKNKAADYESVRKAAEAYKNNLLIAKSIFASAVSYTDVINSITKLIPDGVVLDSLNLSESTFGQQNSFSAHAKTYASAAKLKQNFQSSDLFSNVYFQNLTVSSDDSGSAYPVSIVISAILNKASLK